ncbi:hypothetical protein pb186bvf_019034 [Paramecium bursaria]
MIDIYINKKQTQNNKGVNNYKQISFFSYSINIIHKLQQCIEFLTIPYANGDQILTKKDPKKIKEFKHPDKIYLLNQFILKSYFQMQKIFQILDDQGKIILIVEHFARDFCNLYSYIINIIIIIGHSIQPEIRYIENLKYDHIRSFSIYYIKSIKFCSVKFEIILNYKYVIIHFQLMNFFKCHFNQYVDEIIFIQNQRYCMEQFQIFSYLIINHFGIFKLIHLVITNYHQQVSSLIELKDIQYCFTNSQILISICYYYNDQSNRQVMKYPYHLLFIQNYLYSGHLFDNQYSEIPNNFQWINSLYNFQIKINLSVLILFQLSVL